MKKLVLLTTVFIAGSANAGFLDGVTKVLNTTGSILNTVTGTPSNTPTRSISSASGSLVDVNNFDVSGIKLGMTPNEVNQVINARFPNAKIYKQNQRNLLTSKYDVPDFIVVDSPNQHLSVRFGAVSLTGEKNKALVQYIEYSIPDEHQNLVSIKEATVRKYGNPTVRMQENSNFANWGWCNKTVQNGSFCDLNSPSLILYNTKLKLNDPRYSVKLREVISDMNTTKPNI